MPTREEQKELRRKEILNAALNLFIQKGYGGTRIADIAKEVGMSVGLLFHYYESKEKLYEALIEIGVMGPQSMMTMDATDPMGFFTAVAEGILGYIKMSPFSGKMFVLMNQACQQEPVTERIAELLPGLTNIQDSVAIIQRGQQMGQIREGDPLALSVLYWGAIQGIAEAYAMNPTLPLPEGSWVAAMLKKEKKDGE